MEGLISILDADDVLLKTGEKKIEFMRMYFPEQELIRNIRAYECNRTALVPIIGKEFYNRMNVYVKSRDVTLSATPLEGGLEGVRILSELYRNYVLSARTSEETQYVKERLRQLGFLNYIVDVLSVEDPKYKEVKTTSDSKKVNIALQLGASIFVDDDERHMPKEPVEGLQCVLFGEGEKKELFARNHPHVMHEWDWEGVVEFAQKLVPLQYS